ncbi:MAG: D-cysteine desulfhydrase [Acidobacteria bacterium]|nr:MAG: D-cysteine desulfhydrase [Acidobacteriota bacterium]
MDLRLKKERKASLGILPTPLMPLKRLSRRYHCEMWMKRDDLIGMGMGGNKTRKLEYLLGEALEKHCDTVITAGAVQSNHCRQTAAACARLGLECHLLLGGCEQPAQGNLLLDHLFGAKIHWAGSSRKGEDMELLAENLKKQGRKIYLIPYGGSDAVGALGFVYAVEELLIQEKQMNIQTDAILFASSSGGTQAGLVVGNQFYRAGKQVYGIGIDKSPTGEPDTREKIEEIVATITDQSGLSMPEPDIQLNGDFMDRPYAECGELEKHAMTVFAREEGVVLDPVYTGRAFGGLLRLLEAGMFKNRKILLWHTGGAPAIFAYHSQLT